MFKKNLPQILHNTMRLRDTSNEGGDRTAEKTEPEALGAPAEKSVRLQNPRGHVKQTEEEQRAAQAANL